MKNFLIALALVFGNTLFAQRHVPYDTASVMIDGRFDKVEWQQALKLQINDSVSFYIKQDNANIYWCLHAATPKPALVMVDFYMMHGISKLNLHASAKLGERLWENNSYGDWLWWNNLGWQATVARIDKLEERKFLRDEAKEFQLRKARFHEKELALMIDISYPQNLVLRFPAKADTTGSGKWLQLRL